MEANRKRLKFWLYRGLSSVEDDLIDVLRFAKNATLREMLFSGWVVKKWIEGAGLDVQEYCPVIKSEYEGAVLGVSHQYGVAIPPSAGIKKHPFYGFWVEFEQGSHKLMREYLLLSFSCSQGSLSGLTPPSIKDRSNDINGVDIGVLVKALSSIGHAAPKEAVSTSESKVDNSPRQKTLDSTQPAPVKRRRRSGLEIS